VITHLELESIGHLCSSLQAPFAVVRRAINELGLAPALTLNAVQHYDEQQCEQIAEWVRDHRVGPPTSTRQ
jgi:hypothetical protein